LQLAGGEEGLVFSEGNQWKKHRKIISSAFHYEFLKEMVPVIYESAMEQMRLMLKKGETTAIEDFANITGNVVGKVFFGSNFNEHIIDGLPATIYLKELGIKTMEINLTPLVVLFGPRFVHKGLLPSHKAYLAKLKKYMDMSHTLIEDRRVFIRNAIEKTGTFEPTKKSLLDNLILNSMEDPKEGMSNKEICDEFSTFCFAGMDTTGQLVYMTSYHLHENPKILEKVRQEAELYLTGPDISGDVLNKMEYLHAVLQESLRMTGPGSMLLYRQSLEDHMIGNISVKKGTVICVDNVAMHFCPEYHEEPEKFMPERWLDPDSKTRKSITQEPFVYIPFSAGSRNCIGQHLAIMEAKIIIGLFVKMFDFKMRDGYKMRYVRRFMYEPEERIKYKLTLRE
jgi:cytochrome P450 family 4 subfamily V